MPQLHREVCSEGEKKMKTMKTAIGVLALVLSLAGSSFADTITLDFAGQKCSVSQQWSHPPLA